MKEFKNGKIVSNAMQLDCFFYPKNVAVIGASGESKSIGFTIFQNFLKSGFCKKVFPVNPNHKIVQGKKTFQSVKEIPVDLDLAVIVVPAKFVPKVLLECVEKGVEAAIIISAGFSEIGEKKLTAELAEIIRQNPQTRVIGPNCFGITVPENGLDTTFSERRKMGIPKAGNVSFMSQSGALGIAVMDWISTQKFGISKFVSYGNAMDVDETDLLEYFNGDKKTKVITMYLEGVKHGRKFFEIAKKTTPKTPIIALKGGITPETHKATASHTGSLAGSAEVYNALFKQTGIIQAKNLFELFHFAKTLEREPLPDGKTVQIITNGGGYGIITADSVIENGLELSKLSIKSLEKLKKIFPKIATLGNPMDLTGGADSKMYVEAAKTALIDSNVAMVMVLILFNTPAIDSKIVKELIELKKRAKKPLIVVSTGSAYTAKRLIELENGGITTFNYPHVAARCLKILAEYSEFKKEANEKN